MTTSQQINAMEAAVKKRLRDRRTNFFRKSMARMVFERVCSVGW